jgi:hypothetical protein
MLDLDVHAPAATYHAGMTNAGGGYFTSDLCSGTLIIWRRAESRVTHTARDEWFSSITAKVSGLWKSKATQQIAFMKIANRRQNSHSRKPLTSLGPNQSKRGKVVELESTSGPADNTQALQNPVAIEVGSRNHTCVLL